MMMVMRDCAGPWPTSSAAAASGVFAFAPSAAAPDAVLGVPAAAVGLTGAAAAAAFAGAACDTQDQDAVTGEKMCWYEGCGGLASSCPYLFGRAGCGCTGRLSSGGRCVCLVVQEVLAGRDTRVQS